MVVAKRDPRVVQSPDYLAQRKVSRRPQHKFNLKFLPYQIQPFLLAPVLPGETFQNMMIQSQTWSDPLVSGMKNIGWCLHYNLFYVRHRDLPGETRNLLSAMLLNPETDVSSLKAASQSWPFYTHAGGMDWTRMCLQHVVSEYFREEGEDWDHAVIGGLPAAKIYGAGTADAFERLTLEDEYEDRRVDLIDPDGHLYANDLSTMLGHWQALRDAGLTEMDYQDFMKTYGSTVREDEESPNLHRAEDAWAHREFTYPTNTVEPTTGVPAVAAGWRVQKSGGKRLFIDEPGFLFGVTYCRPKIYLGKQRGSVAGSMDDVRAWLPAMLHGQANLGHVQWPFGAGPVPETGSAEEGYWIDMRDLLIYGDQFINYQPEGVPFASLPAADGQRRYAAAQDIQAMFADIPGDEQAGGQFQTDGICTLNIMGRQRPTTRGTVLGLS